MPEVTIEQIERHSDLYEQAVSVCLDKIDFAPGDWLDEADQKEFDRLERLMQGEAVCK